MSRKLTKVTWFIPLLAVKKQKDPKYLLENYAWKNIPFLDEIC